MYGDVGKRNTTDTDTKYLRSVSVQKKMERNMSKTSPFSNFKFQIMADLGNKISY